MKYSLKYTDKNTGKEIVKEISMESGEVLKVINSFYHGYYSEVAVPGTIQLSKGDTTYTLHEEK